MPPHSASPVPARKPPTSRHTILPRASPAPQRFPLLSLDAPFHSQRHCRERLPASSRCPPLYPWTKSPRNFVGLAAASATRPASSLSDASQPSNASLEYPEHPQPMARQTAPSPPPSVPGTFRTTARAPLPLSADSPTRAAALSHKAHPSAQTNNATQQPHPALAPPAAIDPARTFPTFPTR